MLLTMPPPPAASALVEGTLGPSLPGTKPSWLAMGVEDPDPDPVRVPVLEEYSDPLVRLNPDFLIIEERLRLNAELTPNLFKAESAVFIVPALASESPPIDIVPGAEDAR